MGEDTENPLAWRLLEPDALLQNACEDPSLNSALGRKQTLTCEKEYDSLALILSRARQVRTPMTEKPSSRIGCGHKKSPQLPAGLLFCWGPWCWLAGR